MYVQFFSSAVWTVINEGSNQVRLHNNFNYLAIVNGQTMVIHVVSQCYWDLNSSLLTLIYFHFHWEHYTLSENGISSFMGLTSFQINNEDEVLLIYFSFVQNLITFQVAHSNEQ